MTLSSRQVQQLVKNLKAAERLLREVQEMNSSPRLRRLAIVRRSKAEAQELKRLVALELMQGRTPSDIAKCHAVSKAYIYSIRKRLLQVREAKDTSTASEGGWSSNPYSERAGEWHHEPTLDRP